MDVLIKKIKKLKKPKARTAVTMFANDNYNQAIDDVIEVIKNEKNKYIKTDTNINTQD